MMKIDVKPVGYRVLLKPLEVAEMTSGGIILADITKEHRKLAAVVCEVISMGSDAYGDEIKFPAGAWCNKGDFVLIERFAGARFNYDGVEHRVINDDEIICVVDDPDKVTGI